MKRRLRIEPVPTPPRRVERGIGVRGPKRRNPDVIEVACWCKATTVNVPIGEMRNGLTRSCGQPACDRYDTDHRRGNPT